jgi:ketosteroid isomerase-like protein
VEPWEDFNIEIESARSAGDDLVVLFVVFHGKVREGLELETPFVHLLWIKDGKLVRLRSYDDRSAALEAAGLSE